MMLEDLYRLLKSSHVQAQGVVDTMTQPVVVLDQNLAVTTANNAFLRTFKVERDDILGQNFYSLGNGQWDIPELRHLISSVIPKTMAVVGFEVKHDFPSIGQRTFLIDARRLVHPDDNSTSILVIFDDVTESQRHEAEMQFVISESQHRMRNIFALVRAIAMQTETEGRSAAAYRETLLGRIETALRAQQIAASNGGIDLEALVKQGVGHKGQDHIHCDGPAVQISASRVVALSMIFHELGTNALKYGALSVPEGRVRVRWSLRDGPKDRPSLSCEWREEDGPRVEPPRRKGYGTELIQGTSSHLGGTVALSYDPEGFSAAIEIPL